MITLKIKVMKNLLFIIIFAVSLSIGCSSSKQTTNSNSQETKEAIITDQWVFTAQSANPQGGRSRMLTDRNDMRVSKEAIVCYLPYFGRSYSGASSMSNPNPLDFKSADFTINREEIKKGGWRVTVKTKDNKAIQSMIFEFYENGSANLNVTLTDRSPITFIGTVEPLK